MAVKMSSWVFVCGAVLLSWSCASTAESGAVSQHSEVKSLDELPFDENDRLASHVLAFPEGQCAQAVTHDESLRGHDLRGHMLVALAGDAFHRVFGEEEAVPAGDAGSVALYECHMACLEKGTARAVVAHPMPHRYWDGDGTVDDFLQSEACGKVEYGFTNYYHKPINVYWIHHKTGKPVFNQQLGIGERETSFITTFINHKFIFEDPDTKEIIQEVTIPGNGIMGINNHRQHQKSREDVEEEVRHTLAEEWKRHLRIKRTFSPLGFAKGRLPDDMFASLGAYYYNNRFPPHVVLEEWGNHKGVFVNYWETDVNFIQIPWKLKAKWQDRLKQMVESWVGVELETTDMYGMRRYEAGARLLTHVDRHTTHAASLIVNIAQENVTRPWTIEVYDHADRLHEVVMEPGDIVYYESAKSLHGRNTPLHSGSYINLFTHYRPLHDPDWFLRPNPEGTPEPLIDIGSCHLQQGMEEAYSQGAVRCDNPAIGPHLSPTMFEARSGQDLFQWWKSVGPQEEDEMEGIGGGEEL